MLVTEADLTESEVEANSSHAECSVASAVPPRGCRESRKHVAARGRYCSTITGVPTLIRSYTLTMSSFRIRTHPWLTACPRTSVFVVP